MEAQPAPKDTLAKSAATQDEGRRGTFAGESFATPNTRSSLATRSAPQTAFQAGGYMTLMDGTLSAGLRPTRERRTGARDPPLHQRECRIFTTAGVCRRRCTRKAPVTPNRPENYNPPMRCLVTVLALVLTVPGVAAPQGSDAERRILEHIRDTLQPGERLLLSALVERFEAPDEQRALDRLNDVFFRMPLFIAEFEGREGRLPTLSEISGQFSLYGEEAADIVLRIMESDPRVPKFLVRDGDGNLASIDEAMIRADERFAVAVDRSLTGWEGRALPEIGGESFGGAPTAVADLMNDATLVYVWFTNCPPCVQIAPVLQALHQDLADEGLTIVGLNADRVLKLPYTDADRQAHQEKGGVTFANLHLTEEDRAELGNVNIFPTLFLAGRDGTIVRHFVNFQERETLEPAIRELLP